MSEEAQRLERARRGEEGAFDGLVRPHLARLEAFAYRMVAHPDDAAELVQDALLTAYQKLGSFRGDSSFATWLFSILTRRCLDHLRARRRWRWDAQDHARRNPDGPHDAVTDQLAAPETSFEAREHIAFCFSCVSRSLPGEEAAAVFLRDVFSFSNKEAARICGISESVLRHRLSAGRQSMQDAFEGLCGLVSKSGVCYQCAGLRQATPPAQRGPAPPELPGPAEDSYRLRLSVIQGADLEGGRSSDLHRLMFRIIGAQEDPGAGSEGA